MENIFSSQQVSKMTGLSIHTLRYYERIGLISGVNRDANGYRQYSESDITWLEFLIRLRVMGMPISDMKQYTDLRSQGSSTATERRELLEIYQNKVINQMKELKKTLTKIEDKISYFKSLEASGKQQHDKKK
jgi:DNA-binding transcriptional MerR regulator